MKPSFVKQCHLRFAEMIAALISIALGIGGRILIANSKWGVPKANLANDAGFFPKMVYAGFILIGVILLIKSFFTNKEKLISINLMAFVLVGIWALYLVLFQSLGFVVSSILAVFASMILWKVENKAVLFLVSIFVPAALYIGLGVLMHVRFPTLFL